MAATKPGIIYILKDKFQMYSPFSNGLLEYRYPPEIIRDLDVINTDLLESQIKVFVTNNKLQPSSLIIVLADNTYFVKDFAMAAPPPAQPPKPGQPPAPMPKASLEDLKPQINLFIEHVPYENVVSREFPLKTGIRVLAVNQDMYACLKRAFELLGFKVEAVFPGMVLGNNMGAKPAMDGSLVALMQQKASSFNQFNLLTDKPFEPTLKKSEESVDEVEIAKADNKSPDKKRLFMLVGVFGFLIIVLIIVFIQSQQPPPPQPAAATQSSTTQTAPIANPATASAQTQVQSAISPSTADFKELTAQVISAAEEGTTGQVLRGELNKYPFKSITIQTQPNLAAANTTVTFSPKVSPAVKNVVLESVRKVRANVTTQDRANAIDITIVVGK